MRKLVYLIMTLAFSSNVYAGLYLEPNVGYEFGTLEGKFDLVTPSAPGSSIDYDLTGMTYGIRVGYSIPMLVFGVEYTGGTLAYDGKATITGVGTSNNDDDYSVQDLGAFVQVNLPILLNIRAGYVFSSSLDEDDTFEGSGYKAGVGLTMLPFVSINLDYVAINYDEVDDTNTTNLDIDRSGFVLGVSLPLDL